jgi:hypothetical protein
MSCNNTTPAQRVTLTRPVRSFHAVRCRTFGSNSLSNRNDINMMDFPRNRCNGYVLQTVKHHKVETVRVLQYAYLTCLFKLRTLHIPQRPCQLQLWRKTKKMFLQNFVKKTGVLWSLFNVGPARGISVQRHVLLNRGVLKLLQCEKGEMRRFYARTLILLHIIQMFWRKVCSMA